MIQPSSWIALACGLAGIASGIGVDPTLPRDGTDFLEPGLLGLDITSHELFVRLSQIDYAFNDSDHMGHNSQNAATHNAGEQHYESFGCIAQYEFMDSKAAKQNSANARSNFLVCAHGFPVDHRLLIN